MTPGAVVGSVEPMGVPETTTGLLPDGQHQAYVPELLIDHWAEMPHWPEHRELWSFYLTLAGQQDLHRVVRHYQDQLRPLEGLDLVDPSALHITIQGIRFVDETDARSVEVLAEAVRRRLGEVDLPVLSTLGPETDTDAVQLPVVPRESVVRVRDVIQAAVREELGDDFLYKLPEPRNGFDPHVTIAYVNREMHNREIVEALHRAPAPRASFRVEHASLVRLSRRSRRWSWDGERPLAIGVR